MRFEKREYMQPAACRVTVQYAGVVAASGNASVGTGDGELDPNESWSDEHRKPMWNVWQDMDASKADFYFKK